MLLLHTLTVFSMVLTVHSNDEGYFQTLAKPTCVIEFAEWIENNLTVSWELPNDVISNYTNLYPVVTWISQNSYGSCTVTTLTSCMCDYMNDDVMDSDSKFSLNVTILSEKENIVTVFHALWYIDSEACLKPPMVKNINLTVINSTCIKVKWDSTLFYLDEGLYRISYRQTAGNLQWTVILSGSDWPNFTTVHEICGLHPYTGYDVMVQHKLYNWKSQPTGHWSNSTISPIHTDEDVPVGSPGVFEGCYTMINQNCELRNTRVVRIYWEAVEKHLRNGEITSYVIRRVNMVTLDEESIGTTQAENYHYDINLLCDVGYNITLMASTRVGPSANFSRIYISLYSETKDTYSPHEIIPEIDVEQPFINITIMKRRFDIENQHIVWCKTIRENECDGSIDWKPIDSSDKYLTISASIVSAPFHKLKVGISTASSGITWASCLYLKTTEIPSPSNLRVFPSSVKNGIEVVWDSQQCPASGVQPYIVSVEIHVCPTSNLDNPKCVGPALNYTVIGGKHSLVIENLDKEMVYKIEAVSIGLWGTYSPKSRPIYGQPSSNSSFIGSPGFILLIVGSLAFLLSMVFLIRLLTRKVKGHYQKMYRIEVPVIAIQEVNSHSDRQDMTTQTFL